MACRCGRHDGSPRRVGLDARRIGGIEGGNTSFEGCDTRCERVEAFAVVG